MKSSEKFGYKTYFNMYRTLKSTGVLDNTNSPATIKYCEYDKTGQAVVKKISVKTLQAKCWNEIEFALLAFTESDRARLLHIVYEFMERYGNDDDREFLKKVEDICNIFKS